MKHQNKQDVCDDRHTYFFFCQWRQWLSIIKAEGTSFRGLALPRNTRQDMEYPLFQENWNFLFVNSSFPHSCELIRTSSWGYSPNFSLFSHLVSKLCSNEFVRKHAQIANFRPSKVKLDLRRPKIRELCTLPHKFNSS